MNSGGSTCRSKRNDENACTAIAAGPAGSASMPIRRSSGCSDSRSSICVGPTSIIAGINSRCDSRLPLRTASIRVSNITRSCRAC